MPLRAPISLTPANNCNYPGGDFTQLPGRSRSLQDINAKSLMDSEKKSARISYFPKFQTSEHGPGQAELQNGSKKNKMESDLNNQNVGPPQQVQEEGQRAAVGQPCVTPTGTGLAYSNAKGQRQSNPHLQHLMTLLKECTVAKQNTQLNCPQPSTGACAKAKFRRRRMMQNPLPCPRPTMCVAKPISVCSNPVSLSRNCVSPSRRGAARKKYKAEDNCTITAQSTPRGIICSHPFPPHTNLLQCYRNQNPYDAANATRNPYPGGSIYPQSKYTGQYPGQGIPCSRTRPPPGVGITTSTTFLQNCANVETSFGTSKPNLQSRDFCGQSDEIFSVDPFDQRSSASAGKIQVNALTQATHPCSQICCPSPAVIQECQNKMFKSSGATSNCQQIRSPCPNLYQQSEMRQQGTGYSGPASGPVIYCPQQTSQAGMIQMVAMSRNTSGGPPKLCICYIPPGNSFSKPPPPPAGATIKPSSPPSSRGSVRAEVFPVHGSANQSVPSSRLASINYIETPPIKKQLLATPKHSEIPDSAFDSLDLRSLSLAGSIKLSGIDLTNVMQKSSTFRESDDPSVRNSRIQSKDLTASGSSFIKATPSNYQSNQSMSKLLDQIDSKIRQEASTKSIPTQSNFEKVATEVAAEETLAEIEESIDYEPEPEPVEPLSIDDTDRQASDIEFNKSFKMRKSISSENPQKKVPSKPVQAFSDRAINSSSVDFVKEAPTQHLSVHHSRSFVTLNGQPSVTNFEPHSASTHSLPYTPNYKKHNASIQSYGTATIAVPNSASAQYIPEVTKLETSVHSIHTADNVQGYSGTGGYSGSLPQSKPQSRVTSNNCFHAAASGESFENGRFAACPQSNDKRSHNASVQSFQTAKSETAPESQSNIELLTNIAVETGKVNVSSISTSSSQRKETVRVINTRENSFKSVSDLKREPIIPYNAAITSSVQSLHPAKSEPILVPWNNGEFSGNIAVETGTANISAISSSSSQRQETVKYVWDRKQEPKIPRNSGLTRDVQSFPPAKPERMPESHNYSVLSANRAVETGTSNISAISTRSLQEAVPVINTRESSVISVSDRKQETKIPRNSGITRDIQSFPTTTPEPMPESRNNSVLSTNRAVQTGKANLSAISTRSLQEAVPVINTRENSIKSVTNSKVLQKMPNSSMSRRSTGTKGKGNYASIDSTKVTKIPKSSTRPSTVARVGKRMKDPSSGNKTAIGPPLSFHRLNSIASKSIPANESVQRIILSEVASSVDESIETAEYKSQELEFKREGMRNETAIRPPLSSQAITSRALGSRPANESGLRIVLSEVVSFVDESIETTEYKSQEVQVRPSRINVNVSTDPGSTLSSIVEENPQRSVVNVEVGTSRHDASTASASLHSVTTDVAISASSKTGNARVMELHDESTTVETVATTTSITTQRVENPHAPRIIQRRHALSLDDDTSKNELPDAPLPPTALRPVSPTPSPARTRSCPPLHRYSSSSLRSQRPPCVLPSSVFSPAAENKYIEIAHHRSKMVLQVSSKVHVQTQTSLYEYGFLTAGSDNTPVLKISRSQQSVPMEQVPVSQLPRSTNNDPNYSRQNECHATIIMPCSSPCHPGRKKAGWVCQSVVVKTPGNTCMKPCFSTRRKKPKRLSSKPKSKKLCTNNVAKPSCKEFSQENGHSLAPTTFAFGNSGTPCYGSCPPSFKKPFDCNHANSVELSNQQEVLYALYPSNASLKDFPTVVAKDGSKWIPEDCARSGKQNRRKKGPKRKCITTPWFDFWK